MIDGTALGDVLCEGFATNLAVSAMRRIPIDRQGLRSAAEEIVRYESPQGVGIAFRGGDPRLKPYLTAALAQRKASRDERLQNSVRL